MPPAPSAESPPIRARSQLTAITPAREKNEGSQATPVIAQYLEIKAAHPDSLLFYRMGDFYELFFEDAVRAAGALDITLTQRGKHRGTDIPMCGVPVHAADSYLARLIRKGFKVAVCEQVEDPVEARKRGAKAVVRRQVVRVITPGTLTDETLLDARAHNFLAALARAEGDHALAWIDISTGDLQVTGVSLSGLGGELARLAPGEVLVSESVLQSPELFELFGEWKEALTPLAPGRFDSRAGEHRLKQLYGVTALDGFGAFERVELAALGALVDYLETTQKGHLPRLKPPVRIAPGASMTIDAATRRNLELVRNLAGERRNSLLAVIDHTTSSAGARLLAARLSAPLTDPAAINRRQDMVQFFFEDGELRAAVRRTLKSCPDIERPLARLTAGRGGPRDLAAIRDALAESATLRGTLGSGAATRAPLTASPHGISDCVGELGFHETLVERLSRALTPEAPADAREGGFIASGYRPELDEQRGLRDESRRLIAALERRYAEDTGIASLKIRHNNVLGYFMEVTATHADRIGLQHETFIHRQTMANAVRYTTAELGDLEDRISRAAERALALELNLFADLVGEVAARGEAIATAAAALAALDVAAALAELAERRRYVRPIVDDGRAFEVKGGRHAVVEAALEAAGQPGFIDNGCDLAEDRRMWLVTGPNMAGKSTFLRQNALIAILAQIGSYVPAESAHLGVVDRLFSRVGAADDLARGRSTFMVEMVETAIILNQAEARALVILDEIGRGTATFDGLSLAWAIVEHLHEVNRCRGLFATHYHELTSLTAKLPSLACYTVRVREWEGEVVFLHEVVAGAADRSYGVHVAKLAGLPDAVIARATHILAMLEQGGKAGTLAGLADELPLFSTAQERPAAAQPSAMDTALAAIHPDELSPREALEALYRLKACADGDALNLLPSSACPRFRRRRPSETPTACSA